MEFLAWGLSGFLLGIVLGVIAMAELFKDKVIAGMKPYISSANSLEWREDA